MSAKKIFGEMKRRGEIFQIKMLNPNQKKLTLNLL